MVTSPDRTGANAHQHPKGLAVRYRDPKVAGRAQLTVSNGTDKTCPTCTATEGWGQPGHLLERQARRILEGRLSGSDAMPRELSGGPRAAPP